MTTDNLSAKIEPERLNKIAPMVVKHNTKYLDAALNSINDLNLTKKKLELLHYVKQLAEVKEQFELETKNLEDKKNEDQKVKLAYSELVDRYNELLNDRNNLAHKNTMNYFEYDNNNSYHNSSEVVGKNRLTETKKQSEQTVKTPTNINSNSPEQNIRSLDNSASNEKGTHDQLQHKVSKWNLNTSGSLSILILLYGLCLVSIAVGITYFLISS